MQRITPNLWFDGNAQEAVDFYVSVFPDSRINTTMHYPNSAEEGLEDFQLDLAGKVLTIDFTLGGMNFVAINAGPEFKPNDATSFFVNFDPSQMEDADAQIDALWKKLADGGAIQMELGEYPHSKRYGWVVDKYGYSWQLMLTNPEGEPRPFIIPCLLFTDTENPQAEEALRYYVDVFENSRLGSVAKYPADHHDAKAGALMFGDALLGGSWLAAMDSAMAQDYTFTEAVSFSVPCKDQAEIDYLWGKLSAHPENEQCGWCKDKFGVSWQIVPANMGELLAKPGAYAHMMHMKKLVIADF